MRAWRPFVAWLVVAPWVAWTAARVAGVGGGIPVAQLIAFTPYVLPLAVLGGVAAAVLRRRAPALVAAVTAAVLAAVLAPRVISDGDAAATAGGVRVRLMTANLHFGEVPPEAVLDLVRRERVDVLAVQELTEPEARLLAAAGLGERLPQRVLAPRPEGHGTGLYSRLPLRGIAPPPRTTFAMTAGALTVPGAAPAAIVSVHTAAPHGRAATRYWEDDMRALPEPAPGGPLQLLAGDFNATLDHRELRDLLDRGYRDAAERLGEGLRPTWRGWISPWLTLDHVLAPPAVGLRSYAVHRLPASDHRAVIVDLELPRRR